MYTFDGRAVIRIHTYIYIWGPFQFKVLTIKPRYFEYLQCVKLYPYFLYINDLMETRIF